jgi:hypothetical protein
MPMTVSCITSEAPIYVRSSAFPKVPSGPAHRTWMVTPGGSVDRDLEEAGG